MNKLNSIKFYTNQRYNVEIKALPDNIYSAEIPDIPGLCAYGSTEIEALMELEKAKTTAFELMIEQNKPIPLPVRRFEIPLDDFGKLRSDI